MTNTTRIYLDPTPTTPLGSAAYFQKAIENGYYGVIDDGPDAGYAFKDK